MNIMIVDDEFINRRFLETILKKYGECTVVEDGKTALKKYEEKLEKKERYDIIFLDVMMPEMSGFEVMEEIRKKEIEKKIPQCHIIIQTVLGDLTSVEQAFDKGADAYLLKPIKKEEVEAEMKELGYIKK